MGEVSYWSEIKAELKEVWDLRQEGWIPWFCLPIMVAALVIQVLLLCWAVVGLIVSLVS